MTTTRDAATIEVEANGIRFTALAQGEGPLLLCLHGFPDDARTFRHQMGPLAAAGYRVVAPYMRGYAPTGPSPTGNYQSAALARDVIALIDVLASDGKAVVFGHDWGALAAHGAATLAPERIDRLITAAVPHGPRVAMAFAGDYAQQKRSWYVFFFQTVFADAAVAANDRRFIRNLWHDWSPTWDFTEDDIAPVLETLGRPGVLEAALGYYRCMLQPQLQDPALFADQMRMGFEPIAVPTLYLHGRDDGCMGVDLLDGLEDSFPAGLSKQVIEGAGHFVHCEKPSEVNARILEFLKG